ncbi:MAG: xanthine dehydrogenase family protein molybdopterin-binding subunit [Planctomycetota bacterium]|nr:xanthine dehydrogenase family protein molybdopterin-binding subunit [Planctomycetota bacterium]
MAETETATPTWGPNNQHRILNKRIPRVDGPAKTTGTAQYTYDVRLPDMLYARILRCPHANAKVTAYDDSAALKIPGVRAAMQTNANLAYEGAPVAAVAADTPEQADDAIRAIVVKYQVLPHAVTYDEAIKPDAPHVFVKQPNRVIGNIGAPNKRGDPAKVEEAFKTCDAVIEAEYRTPRLHHACLESHGVVVDYRGGDTATVYCSTQATFSIPGDSAKVLGIPKNAVTGIVQYMGGGFGSKFSPGMEGNLACQLSKIAGKPVKLMLNRRDEFLTAGNGSGSVQKIKAGVTRDGTLVALSAQQFRLGGIGQGNLSTQPYIYKAQNSYSELGAVYTNEDSSRALRAPGHPPASFAMESMMDELAARIDMDPVEFRKMNLTGDDAHLRQLVRGAKEIGWNRRKPNGQWPGTLKRGFGCALSTWGGGGGPQCVVDVTVKTDGAVQVAVGTQDLGTGTRTYVRAIVAEELGLEMHDVVEKIGDTRLGNANSSGGSTTAASLSPAVKVAAFNAKKAIAERVAPLLGVPADQVVFADANVSGNGKTLSWKQACMALPTAGVAVRGEFQKNLAAGGVHGATFAEVEVDVETGHTQVIKMVHVQDVGLPLNRLAVESQINGGMITGIGVALLEQRVMDSDLGLMLNPWFNDYKLPGALEMPELVPLIDDDDPRQAVVGVGEPPSIPGAGAIANAIFNACGVRVRETPITPDKILTGLQKA